MGRFLNFEFENQKVFGGCIENGESELYILKMRNIKMGRFLNF